MTLKEFARAIGEERHVAARVARMIPGVRVVAGERGQLDRLEIPDDAPERVTEEMLAEARAAQSGGMIPAAEVPEESPEVREIREATELVEARRRQIEAEEQLADIERKREARRAAEKVEHRIQRLRLRELGDRKRALMAESQDLEQHLARRRQELADLDHLIAEAQQLLAISRADAETEEAEAARVRAQRVEVQAELAATQAALGARRAELADAEGDVLAAQDKAAAVKADCDGYVAAARERVAALEADEAAWRDATRLFMTLWRGPIMGTVLRALLTVAGALVEGGSLTGTEEARVLAALRGRLVRMLLPSGVGELQAAMEEIAGLMDRRDLSNEQRTAQVSGLARKALARILEQQRGKGNSTG